MILDDLVQVTRKNLKRRQAEVSLDDLRGIIARQDPKTQKGDRLLEKTLAQPAMSVIAEIKQASPSKGQIVPSADFDYLQIARDYTQAQVDFISVLTEEDYFKGSLEILAAVAASTPVPVLRKDFTIDPYMIYEAKAAGASAILLIVAILTDEQLREYQDLAHQLGLSAIVEAHDADEIKRALAVDAKVIGVNNRNLKDFTVDFDNTKRLRALVPDDVYFISESGIKTRADVIELEEDRVNGILVGESFMRAQDKPALVETLRGGPVHDPN
ncbi:indole-3-glycerol phosphate synthase TrpC [Leuconostocaceae bacterium ESL0723]|nr:indole-3-glycerol phosphate synthase TrpC [Leuconostocaceae bacterium ESL0723]